MNTNTAICPNETELLLFKQLLLSEEELNIVLEHLSFCEKCFIEVEFMEIDTDDKDTIIESVKTPLLVKEKFKELDKMRANASISLDEMLNNDGLKIGQIWRPKAEDILSKDDDGNLKKLSFQQLDSIPHLVVITNINTGNLDGHIVIGVTPVHGEFDLIKEDDWLVEAQNSPLGYPILLQSWNHCEMFMDNLEVCFGEISEKSLLKKLESLGFTKNYSNQTYQYSLEAALKRGDFPPHYKPYYFGNPEKITDEKTRNNEIKFFRIREFKETSYLYTPVEQFRFAIEYSEVLSKESWIEKIANLFSQLGTSFDTLPEWLLGVSKPKNANVAYAADNSKVLTANFVNFNGFISITFNKNGKNYLLSEFENPKEIKIIIFDKDRNSLIRFGNEKFSYLVSAGKINSEINVDLDFANINFEDLYLFIVQKEKSK